ncbi:MAG: hypothetical protein ABI972_04280 [Acidobacteriota bacterium]
MPKTVPAQNGCFQRSLLIDDYCLGKLDRSMEAHMEEHYLICPSCAAEVANTQDFLWAFRFTFATLDKKY